MSDVIVGFCDQKTKDSYEKLKHGTGDERELHKFITRAIDDIKRDIECGIKIPHRLIPKEFIKKYNVTNLWKYDLPNAWRLFYTIERDRIYIVAVILEWLDHKKYERKFGY